MYDDMSCQNVASGVKSWESVSWGNYMRADLLDLDDEVDGYFNLPLTRKTCSWSD